MEKLIVINEKEREKKKNMLNKQKMENTGKGK